MGFSAASKDPTKRFLQILGSHRSYTLVTRGMKRQYDYVGYQVVVGLGVKDKGSESRLPYV